MCTFELITLLGKIRKPLGLSFCYIEAVMRVKFVCPHPEGMVVSRDIDLLILNLAHRQRRTVNFEAWLLSFREGGNLGKPMNP